MMMRYSCVCVLLVIAFLSTNALPARKSKKNQLEEGGCESYKYCRGRAFEDRVRVKDWTVTCDSEGVTESSVRDSCCLPQQSHLVCYGIKVEGSLLNYSNDTGSYLGSTDFSDLCKHMVEKEGHTPGTYNSATFKAGGGELAFRYGEWSDVGEGSERHINHIACGIQD